jgi:hypothetical protein
MEDCELLGGFCGDKAKSKKKEDRDQAYLPSGNSLFSSEGDEKRSVV